MDERQLVRYPKSGTALARIGEVFVVFYKLFSLLNILSKFPNNHKITPEAPP